MAEIFLIKGGKKLEGEIEINGSKNATGALMAASLLTEDELILDNVPLVSDVLNQLSILEEMGADVEWMGKREVKIRAGNNVDPTKINFEKVARSRMSVLLIGGLLSRFKEFKFSTPGGDKIGIRPITTHLSAFRQLGVEVNQDGDFYYFKTPEHLTGREIILSEFSVTATENIIIISCLADGKTIIKGAACEPHVQDLCNMLNEMGADIKGIGSHTLEIIGVKELKGAKHKIVPELIEAGTFIAIGAGNGKRILIKNIIPEHLDLFLAKMKEIGVDFKKMENAIEVFGTDKFKAANIQALPYPGFPTDLLPLAVPLLTQANGKSLIHDPLYLNRFNYAQELRKMGADIEIVDPHRAFVFGKTPLKGLTIESWDIRAGAALVVAGLMAEGTTIIKNIEQIDRGYERIEEKLQNLGADIKRKT